MSRIAEKYSTARTTSNLKSEPRTRSSAADVLGAAGMAGQTQSDALLLWSVCYGGKTSQKLALIDGLTHKLTQHMFRRQLPGDPRHIAQAVLAYYLHARCSACDGVGFQIVPHTITRSDEPCPDCGGSGKPHPPADEAFTWLHSWVSKLISIAGTSIMRKMESQMHL